MATLTATTISRAGQSLAGAAAGASGDQWANTGKEFLIVTNASIASINVTLDIQKTVDGQAVTDPIVAVGAGITKIIGPFPTGAYNNSTTGRAGCTYSAYADVTVKVIKCEATT